MKNRLFVFLICIFGFGLSASLPAGAQTTIYVVRHAEKLVEAGNRNPGLSEAGTKRAKDLCRTLRSAQIHACLSTKYKRTMTTLEPTAKKFGLKVNTYRAGNEKGLAEKLAKDYAAKNVLVSGHSNTVPAILKHLGVKTEITMGDKDYDHLFVVKIAKDGKISFNHLHYGAENPK